MSLKQLSPWRWGGLRGWKEDDRPYESFFEGMNSLHKEMELLFNGFWENAKCRVRDWQFMLIPQIFHSLGHTSESLFHR